MYKEIHLTQMTKTADTDDEDSRVSGQNRS